MCKHGQAGIDPSAFYILLFWLSLGNMGIICYNEDVYREGGGIVKIEAIKIKNYRVFQDVKVENIPNMAVFLGMNGTGKTTFLMFLVSCMMHFRQILGQPSQKEEDFVKSFHGDRRVILNLKLSSGLLKTNR